jgi:hypothetical protein
MVHYLAYQTSKGDLKLRFHLDAWWLFQIDDWAKFPHQWGKSTGQQTIRGPLWGI